MCLFTDNKEGLISKKAIKCYKLFEKGKEENTLISPIARTVHYCEEGKEIYGHLKGDLYTAIRRSTE